MEQDKTEELVNDATEINLSNCCGAKIYSPDICSECFEHCVPEVEEVEAD